MSLLIATASLWLPEQASTTADSVDQPWAFVLWLSVALFVGLMGTAAWFMWRYRRSANPEPTSTVDHNTTLEVTWTLLPAVILLVLFVWGFRGWMDGNVAPAESLDIRANARQWGWTFTYPDEGIVSDELVVPVGKPVQLTMTSADVIHSFYVPEMRIKADVLPERYSSVWFEATHPGSFNIPCAEYCGRDHSRMVATLKVLPEAEYLAWIDSGGGLAGLSSVELGERLFKRYTCNQCHSVDGSPGTGPTLDNAARHTREYLRESIQYPNRVVVEGYQPRMPSFDGSMRDKQLEAVLDYLKSLSTEPQEAQ